jgi:hypothetical protein
MIYFFVDRAIAGAFGDLVIEVLPFPFVKFQMLKGHMMNLVGRGMAHGV